MRRSLTIISLLVALAVLLTAAPTAARKSIALGISNPNANYQGVVENHKDRYGYYPALFSVWSSWGSRGNQGPNGACKPGPGNGSCYFPNDKVDYLMQRGITPVIWWQPVNPKNDFSRYSKYSVIASGGHDVYIKEWAKQLKAASARNGDRKIMVRFAHEATGPWFPWGLGVQPGNANTKTTYKKAWRRIVNLFKNVGARQDALFMWSNFSPRKSAYPGDAFVDYVGFTVLNKGKQPGKKNKWRWMPPIVNKGVRTSLSFTKKPIILAEVASFHKGAGKGGKASWIRNGYLKTYANHPKVHGIMYLDTWPKGQRGQPDWRLILPKDGPTIDRGSAVRAYRGLISQRGKFGGQIR